MILVHYTKYQGHQLPKSIQQGILYENAITSPEVLLLYNLPNN